LTHENVNPKVDQKSHRRKRHVVPVSTRRAVYDWVALSLLLAAPAVGVFLFGAVRLWSICPLMLLTFMGVTLFWLRPFLAQELRTLKIPIGGIFWLVFLVYGIAMIPRSVVSYDSKIEMLKIASYLGAYWAWTELAAWKNRWRILLGIFLVVVTTIAWYAIIQHAHGSRMVLNLERPEGYGMRASGTYFCPNHFAHLLELALPVAFILMIPR